MTNNSIIPWDRYALIVELTQRFKDASSQFGKTTLQKIIYLLQEGIGINFGYQYVFYLHGPFSSLVSFDLDQVENMNGVEIKLASSGFQIEPGCKAEKLKKKGEFFINNENINRAIDRLVKDFGGLSTRDIELRATTVYAAKCMRKNGDEVNLKNLMQVIHELKPRFSLKEIEIGIKEMSEKGYIQLSC